VVKRPEVISQIKDIFDSKISYPRVVEDEVWCIDVMIIVYVVTDTSGDADYLTVNCTQFHNINAAQAGSSGALEDSSSAILAVSDLVDEVLNFIDGDGEGSAGVYEEGKVEEETAGKEN